MRFVREVIIAIILGAMLLWIVAGASVSFNAKVKAESRAVDCIAGYTFVGGKQIIGANGGGVVCVMDSKGGNK